MMEENNNKISALQFACIGYFLVNALFFGLGVPILLQTAKQDSWIVGIISIVISIIPILILIYIINYQPDKNIFAKMKVIFGKIIGTIINFALCIFAFFIIVISLKNTTSFATTIYLTKTPATYIAIVYIGVAIYAVIKGIETIGRLSEILFFLAMAILIVIVISLRSQFVFDELKPILANGIMPVFKNVFIFLSYMITPLLLLTTIPKNDIVKKKNYYKYLFGGIFIGFMYVFAHLLLTPGVVSAKLAELYRFPAYYVLRKISIGGAINNLENFLIAPWFFNTFMIIVTSLYFLNVYIKSTFTIKKEKIINISIIAIGLIAIAISNMVFKNPLTLPEIMKKEFPFLAFSSVILVMLVTSILIFIKKRKEKRAMQHA